MATRQARLELLALRRNADLAATQLRKQWPQIQLLRAAARVIAGSVRVAHAEAPASWSLSLFKHFVRLNVGQISVLELWSDAFVIYGVAGPRMRRGREHRLPFAAYAAINRRTERWSVDLPDIPHISRQIIKRHHELVRLAARSKRVSPFKKSHSPGALAALAALARGQIPQPEYAASATNLELATATSRRMDGALFGSSEQNAAVERAAVQLVVRQLRADGWRVQSVERERCGYDLRCENGRSEWHVEVKGTRSAATQFVMTAGEVRRALEDSRFVLFVVGRALSSRPIIEQWNRRQFERQFELSPLQYIVRRARD